MDAWDYPVTYKFGYSEAYGGYHTGEDRPTPMRTPVPVNGVVVGLTGNTGKSTGPHLHVGKIVAGAPVNPGGAGATLGNDAVVTQIDTVGNGPNGKFVRVRSGGADWVYLHLSEIKVKVGDVLLGGDVTAKEELDLIKYKLQESEKALRMREQLTDTLNWKLSESEKALRVREQQAAEQQAEIERLKKTQGTVTKQSVIEYLTSNLK